MNISKKFKNNLTTLYFFAIGLWSCFLRSVIINVATEDILAGSLLSSTVVIISFGLPDIVSKVVSPFIVRRISFLLSIIFYVLLITTAILLIVVFSDVNVRVIGSALCGFANGLIIITTLRIIACYDQVEKNVSALQTGSNFSALFASFVYTGVTTWLCVAPRTTMAACLPFSWLVLVFYAFLDKEPLKNHSIKKTCSREQINYTPVSSTDYQNTTTLEMSAVREIVFFVKVFPFLSYFFLSYFIFFVSTNSVLTTIIFPSASFLPRDHYQYYKLLSDVGLFIGGMELLLVSCISPDWLTFFKIRKIWLLVLLSVGHLMFFVFASWHHFVSNVYVILVMCLTQGLLHGSTVVQSLASSADSFQRVSDKGTALGIVEVGSSLGRLTAGLTGLFIEKYLREHCTNRLMLGVFCLARFQSTVGWNENRSDCK